MITLKPQIKSVQLICLGSILQSFFTVQLQLSQHKNPFLSRP